MAAPERVERVDLAALKARVDLLALVGRDTRLRKVANTRGGEWAGPCPFCGGEDRFRVQPNLAGGGRWWCRHCCGDDRWRDAVAYVMERRRLPFREAVAELVGGGAGIILPSGPVSYRAEERNEPVAVEPEPSPTWREKGESFVAWAEAQLWADRPEASAWRDWLRARGLREETLRAWRVGLSPRDWHPAPAAWGHPPGTRFWIPAGVVLPWYAGGALWQLKVRRPDELVAGGEPKYRNVAGGHPVLYGADRLADRRVAVLTEGEFDCLLLWQEAGALVGVATLGNAQKGIGARALRLLLPVARLLVAYDADADGQRGASRLAALSSRVRPLRVPAGKDVTEFWRGGGRLADWIRFALAREEGVPPVPAPDKSGEPEPDEEELGDALEGEPLPDACDRCGAPVDYFTAAGEPRCGAHYLNEDDRDG